MQKNYQENVYIQDGFAVPMENGLANGESQYFTKDGYILAGCIWGDERIYMNSLASMSWPTLMDNLQIDKNNFENTLFSPIQL